MRTFWAKFAAVLAVVAGIGLGASSASASAAPASSASAASSSAHHASPSDIWW